MRRRAPLISSRPGKEADNAAKHLPSLYLGQVNVGIRVSVLDIRSRGGVDSGGSPLLRWQFPWTPTVGAPLVETQISD